MTTFITTYLNLLSPPIWSFKPRYFYRQAQKAKHNWCRARAWMSN